MPDNEIILQRWRALIAECEALAERYMIDPTAAALEGVEPEYETGDDFVMFGGRGERQVRNELAAWLRAVARLHINQHIWKYRIVEAIGGQAFFALLAFNGEVDAL
jgi:hypothetical protein